MRSGQFIKQVQGYTAFIPAPLPPNPPINMDSELTRLLSDADRSLGRLDGATSILPNPNLFVAMYVRKEAVLSSHTSIRGDLFILSHKNLQTRLEVFLLGD